MTGKDGAEVFGRAAEAALEELRYTDLDTEVVKDALVAAAQATVGRGFDLTDVGMSADQAYRLGVVTAEVIAAAEQRGREQGTPAYQAAVDELHRHRQAAALAVADLNLVLAYRQLPVTARRQLQETREALVAQATGRVAVQPPRDVRTVGALNALGVPVTLTRAMWEADLAAREAAR